MHINLNKLQQTVTEAELSEADGVSKTFKRAFLRKEPPQKGKHSSMQSRSGGEVAEESPQKVTVPNKQAKPPSPGASDEMDKGSRQCEDDIEVAGQTVKMVSHDQLPSLATCKMEDGKALRAAEKEINDSIARMKQPPPCQARDLWPKHVGKEQHCFTRAYATMTLSVLRATEKVHETRKKAEELVRKANLVSKVKQERIVRQSRMEEFHRSLRENVLEWRNEESERLEKARAKQKAQNHSEIMKQSQIHDAAVMNMQKQLEDQDFASEFGRQNTLVGSTLSKEDRKASKNSVKLETKERVQLARDLSTEQQELVKRYMELRKAKLIREGTEKKRELDTKTLEAVSQRLMDAKRKVAKEVARKQTAKTAIALAKEELRCGPRGPGEQRPAARGNVVRTDSNQDVRERREEQLEAFAKKQSEYTSPAHVRRMNFEAHKTWQRGAEAMESSGKGSHHFPILPASSRSAIMYEMMAPGPVMRSQVATPSSSSNTQTHTSATSTYSILINKYQAVR